MKQRHNATDSIFMFMLIAVGKIFHNKYVYNPSNLSSYYVTLGTMVIINLLQLPACICYSPVVQYGRGLYSTGCTVSALEKMLNIL